MKGAIITHPGLEAVSGKELKDLIGVDCALHRSAALFETGELEDFCTLCYRAQSAMKVLYLFFESKFKCMDDILKQVGDCNLNDWLKDKKFVVRSKVVDNEDISTMESERAIGEVIHEKFKGEVDLDNPDITFFTYIIEDKVYFGVDFAGFDLSKRNYKIFALADSIKASVAYSLVRLAGYKKGMVLLDPFTHSGTVAIEAAIYATNKPVNFYNKDKFAFPRFPHFKGFDLDAFFAKHDKFDQELKGVTASDAQQRHLKCAEKNAKIAGVNKQIKFTRMEVEWLDTKFEKESVDRIVSNPPKVSRLLTEKGIEKVFQELFYTANFILKPDGRIVLLVKNYKQILNHATRHSFLLTANFPIKQGKEEFNILIFEKDRK